MNPTKVIRVRKHKSMLFYLILFNTSTSVIHIYNFLDLIQQLKLPEDSMFSGFTPIIGYELKPIFIKTTSDRVCIYLYFLTIYIGKFKHKYFI